MEQLVEQGGVHESGRQRDGGEKAVNPEAGTSDDVVEKDVQRGNDAESAQDYLEI
jgi:hypothetical protein